MTKFKFYLKNLSYNFSKIFYKGLTMKKMLFGIAMVVFAVNFAFARGGGFLGVELGLNELTAEFNEPYQTPNGIYSKIGLKGGYDFDIARIYGQYNFGSEPLKNEHKINNREFVLGIDFTPTLINNFKLLAGLYTGISKIELAARTSIGFRHKYKKEPVSGGLIGIKIGAMYDIDTHSFIEFGMKKDRALYKTKENKEMDSDYFRFAKSVIFMGYTYKF